jgi:hypothetical protein
MKSARPIGIYLLIMALLIALGLPSRIIPKSLPSWYVQYFGDYLWAMLIFFGIGLVRPRWVTRKVFTAAILFTYVIEFSQLFHPPWLEYLRSIKLCALVLGYGFLWSDLIAYTLGISTGAMIEWFILRRRTTEAPSSSKVK